MSQQQQVIPENSWVLPTGSVPVSKIKEEANRILAKKFADTVYDKGTNMKLKEATDELSKSLKGIISNRYKFAVQLTVSEKVGQAIFSGSMSLWDAEHDNYVTTVYETPTFLVIAVVFCCLLE